MLNISHRVRNVSQNYEVTFHTNYDGYYFLREKEQVLEKLEPLCITGENVKR